MSGKYIGKLLSPLVFWDAQSNEQRFNLSNEFSMSSSYDDRRDANKRGENNPTYAVRYVFSSTTPNKTVTVFYKVRSRSLIISCLIDILNLLLLMSLLLALASKILIR